MIEILWEFAVREERRDEFEKEYSAKGAWAEFFRRSAAYQGTKLLAGDDNRYITWDRWESQEAYEEFRLANRAEYDDLDTKFAALRTSEHCLGVFQMK
jgi:heme-degrading monooxygenase HmoA